MATTKHITIIGGGIAGLTAALILSRCYHQSGQPVHITIFDRRPQLMLGASFKLARLHMGGEYPLDVQTAEDCVIGAYLFAQIFPRAVFSKTVGIDYLATQESVRLGQLSVKQLEDSYHVNQRTYERLFNLGYAHGYNSPLGSPEQLCRQLNNNEFSPAFAGGVRAKEWAFDSRKLNTFLVDEVISDPHIKIQNNTDIITADATNNGFVLKTRDDKVYVSDLVINASWESAFHLNKQINPGVRMPKAYLRLLGLANITKCTSGTQAIFALLNASGCMVSPVDQRQALIYVPAKGISHLRTLTEADLAPENRHQLELSDRDEKRIIKLMYDHVITLHPGLKNMVLEKLHVSPTFSFDGELSQRRHASTLELAPNWYSLMCTKATYAVRGALELVSAVLPEMLPDFDLNQNPVIPSFLHL